MGQSEGTVIPYGFSQDWSKIPFHRAEDNLGVITISQELRFNPLDGEHEVHLDRRKLYSVESHNVGWSLPFPQRNHSKLHATAVNQSVCNITRCF